MWLITKRGLGGGASRPDPRLRERREELRTERANVQSGPVPAKGPGSPGSGGAIVLPDDHIRGKYFGAKYARQ
jgi:hypothetical protein